MHKNSDKAIVRSIKKPFAIALYSVRQRILSPRIICIFVLMAVFVWNSYLPILSLVGLLGVKTNPLIFTFFSDDVVKQRILYLGIVFLFSDAPFMDKTQPYVIIRSKRTAWGIGQILHIIIFSAIAFMALMLFSVLILLPDSSFMTDGWGKLVTTLSQTNAGTLVNAQFGAAESVITYYSPLQAFSLCFLLNWCMTSFLGLLIFALDLIFNKPVALIAGGSVVFFDMFVYNSFSFKYLYFSPLSLARLSNLDNRGVSTYPSLTYAFCYFAVAMAILSVLIIIAVKKHPVEASVK